MSLLRRFGSVILFAMASGALTHAQISCEKALMDAAKASDANQIQKILDFNGDTICMVELVLLSPQYDQGNAIDVAWLAQVKATVQQNGSSVGTGGTTNLVSKGESAKIISLAAEYGALKESVNNQTITAQGTFAGIPIALIRNSIFADCAAKLVAHQPCASEPAINVLSRFSYSVSFDASTSNQTLSGTPAGAGSGSATPVTFIANAHQINQVTGKIVIIPGKPASSSEFVKAVDASVKAGKSPTGSAAATIVNAAKKLKDTQNNRPQYEQWLDKATALLTSKKPDEIVSSWRSLACSMVNLLGGPHQTCLVLNDDTATSDPNSTLLQDAVAYAEAYSNYLVSMQAFTESLRGTPVLSFEYDNNRPASQPVNSSFRLIYGQGVGKWTFTGNFAASIYDSTPSSSIPGGQRLRDIQAGFEADRDMGALPALGPAVLSGSYYFQNQTSPAILNVSPSSPITGINFTGLPPGTTQVFAQKGAIHVAQLRLGLGPSHSNLRFPISVSWSNRTELITKPVWRGQIGISYDFDSLFSGSSSRK